MKRTRLAILALALFACAEEPAATPLPAATGDREIEALVTALSSEVAAERRVALESLTDLGYRARLALPHVESALADEDGSVRIAAAEFVYDLSARPAALLLPVLTDSLESDDEDVKIRAANLLGALGRDALAAAPALVRAAADPGTAYAAARALARMRFAPETAVPILLAALDGDERVDATRFLGWFGADAAPAVPRLIVIYGGRNLSPESVQASRSNSDGYW